jgi:hypothetical protein
VTFKPAIWFPIAVGLSIVNLVAVVFPAPVGAAHASFHATLAVACALWAQRLRRRAPSPELPSLPGLERLDALQEDVSTLQQQLVETQERLDFVERLLAREPEARRVDPQR